MHNVICHSVCSGGFGVANVTEQGHPAFLQALPNFKLRVHTHKDVFIWTRESQNGGSLRSVLSVSVCISMVWHWNCTSALYQNSWRTKGVRCFNLPVDPELRRKYQLVLKNENVNWTRQYLFCSLE